MKDNLLRSYIAPVVFNPFDTPLNASNSNHIKALLLIQTEIVRDVLNDRQKLIVELCICKEIPQKQVASMLGVTKSTVSRILKTALCKIRQYLVFCDKALSYYQREVSEK